MKKLCLVLAMVLCVGMLAGCGKENPEKFGWASHDSEPFVEFIERSERSSLENSALEIVSTEVTIEEGWNRSENLEGYDLEKNEKAYTYILETEFRPDNGSTSTIKAKTYYFMKYKEQFK